MHFHDQRNLLLLRLLTPLLGNALMPDTSYVAGLELVRALSTGVLSKLAMPIKRLCARAGEASGFRPNAATKRTALPLQPSHGSDWTPCSASKHRSWPAMRTRSRRCWREYFPEQLWRGSSTVGRRTVPRRVRSGHSLLAGRAEVESARASPGVCPRLANSAKRGRVLVIRRSERSRHQ